MTTSHPQPLWLTIVRGIQLLLALVTLGLSAYGISIAGSYAGYGINIFTTIVTLFYIGYIVASTVFVPTLFNIWTSLMFQAFLSIFWLATFGTLAALSVSYAVVDEYDDYDNDDDYYYTYRGNRYDDISDYFRTAAATTKASTALAAVVWILFVATLIYTVISAIRHRGGARTAPDVSQEHKLGPVAGQPTPTSYQPVEQYVQQPQYGAPYGAPGAEYPPQQQFQEQPTGYPQQFQQPTAYPQQTVSPAPGGYVQQTPYQPTQ
ncbi:hypothetical protein ACLOAV_000386 [Pseudogymnoascus australis]